MKEQEKQLFLELCRHRSDTFREELLPYATPWVLGQIFSNRMQGIAYCRLRHHRLLERVPREFAAALSDGYEMNLRRGESYLRCVDEVSALLEKSRADAVMLKGAWLCSQYPPGWRTAHDIDLLCDPKKVTELGEVLTEAGFAQGYLRCGEFFRADRREIVTAKMMRGETVPFVRRVSLPGMPYLEVDLNFSVTYRGEDGDVAARMLENAAWRTSRLNRIRTPEKSDFFLHLCCHLYKEATTLPWIERKRDMTLYKYSDIYLLLSQMSDLDAMEIFGRARVLGLTDICAYAVFSAAELFSMEERAAVGWSREILSARPDLLRTVVSPKEKKYYLYPDSDIVARFFDEDRAAHLQEADLPWKN